MLVAPIFSEPMICIIAKRMAAVRINFLNVESGIYDWLCFSPSLQRKFGLSSLAGCLGSDAITSGTMIDPTPKLCRVDNGRIPDQLADRL